LGDMALGRMTTLKSLATALGVGLDELTADEPPAPRRRRGRGD
jgi:hypothetical protein